jgi:hypothetical protein
MALLDDVNTYIAANPGTPATALLERCKDEVRDVRQERNHVADKYMGKIKALSETRLQLRAANQTIAGLEDEVSTLITQLP